ncbi:MAG: DNA-processing protein DprA [Mucinivorans sp.]
MICDIALTLIERVGPRTCATLIDTFGSACAVLDADYEKLTQSGVGTLVAENILREKQSKLLEAKSIINLCQVSGVDILVRGGVGYPTLLAECSDAPHVLYKRGTMDLTAGGKWLSVVGTRKATALGLSVCANLVRSFAAAYDDGVVVSGLALGIDKCSHVSALEFGAKTVAVMAGWVDDIVPTSHYWIARKIVEAGGALVSDMPPGTVIAPANFISRNRIIAGLSSATVVVESAAKGGSLITADIAASYDREVFAVPGRADDKNYEGTNALIRSSKAILYQDISDIASVMQWQRNGTQVKESDPSSLEPTLMKIYTAAPDTDPFTLEEISEKLDVPIYAISSALIRLEVLGFIKSMQGRLYQKARY